MCGEYERKGFNHPSRLGSTPHVRGIGTWPFDTCRTGGNSPAYTGNIIRRPLSYSHIREQPRIRGEHISSGDVRQSGEGSTPHVRGIGSVDVFLRWLRWEQPRMCGEYSSGSSSRAALGGTTPHVRGIDSLTIKFSSNNRVSGTT